MNKEITVIFGGTGFIGRDIAQKLLKKGSLIKIFSKSPEKATDLKTNAALGQLQNEYIDITNEGEVKAAITGANTVINLIGIKSGSAKDFFTTHVLFPKMLAKLVKALGIKKFIHFSTIGVDKIYDSKYAHSKYEGEQRIRTETSNYVVIRPSLVFGQQDDFLHKLHYSLLNSPLLITSIQQIEFKPIYVGDVSNAALAILENYDKYKRKAIDLVGEKEFSMNSILEIMQTSIEKNTKLIKLPKPLYRSYVLISRFLPNHLMSKEYTHILRYNHKAKKNLFDQIGYSLSLHTFINSLGKSEKACER
jgi:NADH dehydrogenase